MLNSKIKRKIKFIIRGSVNSVVLKLLHRDYNIKDAIIVAGTSRSGSTWLAEILNSIPNSSILFEPLSPTNVLEAKRAGFSFNTFLDPNENWPEGYEYMKKVLSGKVLTPWTTSQIPITKAINTKIWIIKFVRVNVLLGWLTANFPIKPPILIIRHPCSNIVSQMRKGWVPKLPNLLQNNFFVHYPLFKEFASKLQKPEEKLALHWCMRYFSPLVLPQPHPFLLVSYESLVTNGEEEIKRIFNVLKMPIPKKSFDMLQKPSSMITDESRILNRKNPISGWEKDLSRDQIKRILNVINTFGLDFYSENYEPDYARLYSNNPINFEKLQ